MKNNDEELRVGFYGISGCAGCLLTVLYEKCFEELTHLVDIKSFPLIKEDEYEGQFDYLFVEGTVCFDEDIIKLNKLRDRAENLVALGSCACFGGVPSLQNFKDKDEVMRFVYPSHNKLKEEPPTPLNKHVEVDYYIPQCPPNPEEIVAFIKDMILGKKFKKYKSPVCFECRKKGNKCLLEGGELCLGPVTRGGCKAICPSNGITCYGCRGPCPDANFEAFMDVLKEKGFTKKQVKGKMETFAGLQFKEENEKSSTWLEK